MKKDLLILLTAIVLIGLGSLVYGALKPKDVVPSSQACTMEAKLCPDGSSVGRTGPNCEFQACPDTATSTQATSTGTTSGGSGGIMPFKSGIQGTVTLG